MKRRVTITYFAHLTSGETVTWEREDNLTPEEDQTHPGFALEARRSTGVTVDGAFYPFSSISHIDWKVDA